MGSAVKDPGNYFYIVHNHADAVAGNGYHIL